MTGESEEDASDYRQRLRESAEKVIASKLRERERKRIHDKNPNPITKKTPKSQDKTNMTNPNPNTQSPHMSYFKIANIPEGFVTLNSWIVVKINDNT